MKKTQAINLTQKVFRFKSDNVVENDGFNFYNWRKGELLHVLGVMELEPGKPHMCVGVGKELFDFEHIDLEEFENVVDMSRDFSTELPRRLGDYGLARTRLRYVLEQALQPRGGKLRPHQLSQKIYPL